MSQIMLTLEYPRRAYRLAVGCLFFLLGLCFASWASRIPSIQQNLHLSNGALGVVLFALPAGSMVSLPFSGWLINRFSSKRVAITALIMYSVMLVLLGLAATPAMLVSCLFLFGMAGNVSNISINTQAVGVEGKYGKNIMGSFHGLWSLAGFTAAGIGSVMIGKNIMPFQHFMMIIAVILLGIAASFQYLLNDEEKRSASRGFFTKPDRLLIRLGLIAFCCMICEGAMFDWSGIYFKKVVGAEPEWVGTGYTAFMCTMATGRFVADWIAGRIGFRRTVQLSGLLIMTGLLTAVLFPALLTAIAGFLLVGFGVSSVVPLVYSEAGKSTVLSAGAALAAVSSIGFLGFLIGPPLIGITANFFSLKVSFLIIAGMGLSVSLFAGRKKGSALPV